MAEAANQDPKIAEFNAKIKSVEDEIKSISSYTSAYTSSDGFFDIDNLILKKGGEFENAIQNLYDKAKKIRNDEDDVDDNGSTYVIVVRDATPIYSTRNPKNWVIDDAVYFKYAEPYTDASKQKEKDEKGKTPLKRFQIMERNYKNSSEYKEAKKIWKQGCKVYTTWTENIDKERKLKRKKVELEEQKQKYIDNKTKKDAAKQAKADEKKQKADEKAEQKLNNSKSVSAVREKLREWTDGVWGAKEFANCSTSTTFMCKFYKPMLGVMYSEEYARLELSTNGSVYQKEVEQFTKAKIKAEIVIKDAETTLEAFKTAYSKDNKTATADYTQVQSSYNLFKEIAEPLVKECSENQHKVEEAIGKRQEQEVKDAQQSSSEADKELNKKELGDNIPAETLEKMKAMETTGQGGLDGKSTSPGMAGGAGDVNQAEVAGNCSSGAEKEKEEKKDPNKYQDEDKWDDKTKTEARGQASGLSQQQINDSSIQMSDALANIATNIIGAFATDPMLAGQVTGMISTGTFNAQSLEGMGNMMLASSVNTLTNAMMNATGIGAVEEVMDDALSATATIITTATNIVPMVKELTVATVMTVTDELTSHIVEKVESILDPSAITSQITYYMGYYTSLYTASADDLKKKLLSPGDQAMSDALEAKTEENKNAKMTNMMAKITDLKNKASEGIAMAKAGVKMVTTYINNGPDWVVKQLSTYTNFAIAQAEKYIDYGADYVIDQRDSFVSMIGESIGKRVAEQVNKVQEQTLKKALDYIEVKKKYAIQVAMAAIMTAVQIVVAQLGPMIGMALKMGAKMGMKQLLKTIGG